MGQRVNSHFEEEKSFFFVGIGYFQKDFDRLGWKYLKDVVLLINQYRS